MSLRSLLLPLVAVSCGAAGFLAYQHWMRPSGGVVVTAPVTANVTPDTTAAAAPAAPVVAESVPNLKLRDLSNRQHALAEYHGAPTLYNFWATWCAPCRREIPLLNRLYAEHRNYKLQMVGVAVDYGTDVRKFLATTPISYSVLIADQDGASIVSGFGMELVLPFSVFADAEGRIIAVKVGELHDNEASAILAAVQALNAGQLSLAAARERISAQLRQFSIERATSGR
jgi:thiol-disulfide isomerase/thioredoxin